MTIQLPPYTGQDDLDYYLTEIARQINSGEIVGTTAGVMTTSDGFMVSTDNGTVTDPNGNVVQYLYRYLHVAYASNNTGSSGFTTGLHSTQAFYGLRNSASSTESTNPADYSWIEISSPFTAVPSFRTIGGRRLDFSFTSSTPAGFLAIPVGAIDLDSLPGATGADGNSVGVKSIYIRSNSNLTVAPTGGTFNTSTGVYASLPSGWFESVPTTGTDDIYISTANIFGDGTLNLTWSAPSLYGQVSTSSTNVSLYQQTSTNTAPSDPNGVVTYTFSTNVLTNNLNGWSQTQGNNAEMYTWEITATATSKTDTDTIATSDWNAAVLVYQPPLRTAELTLYQRTTTNTAPTDPGSTTYTFATQVLTGTLNSWTQAIPTTGGEYLWVINATASARATTDTILTTDWSTASNISIPNVRAEPIRLYQRTATNTAPADPTQTITYTFATNGLTSEGLNGWFRSIPREDGNNFVWIIEAEARTTTGAATASILTSDWSDASTIAVDSTDGNIQNWIFIDVPRTTTQVNTPAASSGVPTGWLDTPPSVPAGAIWASQGSQTAGAGNFVWGTPQRLSGTGGVSSRFDVAYATNLPAKQTITTSGTRSNVADLTSGSGLGTATISLPNNFSAGADVIEKVTIGLRNDFDSGVNFPTFADISGSTQLLVENVDTPEAGTYNLSITTDSSGDASITASGGALFLDIPFDTAQSLADGVAFPVLRLPVSVTNYTGSALSFGLNTGLSPLVLYAEIGGVSYQAATGETLFTLEGDDIPTTFELVLCIDNSASADSNLFSASYIVEDTTVAFSSSASEASVSIFGLEDDYTFSSIRPVSYVLFLDSRSDTPLSRKFSAAPSFDPQDFWSSDVASLAGFTQDNTSWIGSTLIWNGTTISTSASSSPHTDGNDIYYQGANGTVRWESASVSTNSGSIGDSLPITQSSGTDAANALAHISRAVTNAFNVNNQNVTVGAVSNDNFQEPSESDTDFWYREFGTNAVTRAADDGSTPSGWTSWLVTSTAVAIVWENTVVAGTDSGISLTATEFTMNGNAYYRGPLVQTLSNGTSEYEIRRELPGVSITIDTGVADNLSSSLDITENSGANTEETFAVVEGIHRSSFRFDPDADNALYPAGTAITTAVDFAENANATAALTQVGTAAAALNVNITFDGVVTVGTDRTSISLVLDPTAANIIRPEVVIVEGAGSNTDPLIEVGDQSSYTLFDYANREVLSLSSAVADVLSSDRDFVIARMVDAVVDNVETPVDFTASRSGSSLVVTATDTGQVTGLWKVVTNHATGNGNLFFGEVTTTTQNEVRELQSPTRDTSGALSTGQWGYRGLNNGVPQTNLVETPTAWSDVIGNSIGIVPASSAFDREAVRLLWNGGDITFTSDSNNTNTATLSISQISVQPAGIFFVVDGVTSSSGVPSFTGAITLSYPVTITTTTSDGLATVTTAGSAGFSASSFPSGTLTANNYIAATPTGHNFIGERVVSWGEGQANLTEPAVSTNTADYSFTRLT